MNENHRKLSLVRWAIGHLSEDPVTLSTSDNAAILRLLMEYRKVLYAEQKELMKRSDCAAKA